MAMVNDMITLAQAEPEDLSSLYDLEYRANEDDAWYSVHVVFDSDAQTLTVNYLCSPEYSVFFSTDDFETESEVDELVARCRPVSQQLQDYQCRNLSIGTAVCAAYGTADHDLRFFDAIVDAVNKQAHLFADGEEECLCDFVLFWQHGPGCGTLTSANIASICITELVTQLDPRISSFAIMAKKKIASRETLSAIKRNCVSTKKKLKLSQNKLPEMDPSMTLKHSLSKSEDSVNIRSSSGWTSQDDDMRPKPCNFVGFHTPDYDNFVLISNLEKDLKPSSIRDFIYKQTTILPQAFVFPGPPSDPFTRGTIMVDSQKKVQIIREFLENPNHLVVSSRGRPWVVTEKATAGTFGTNILNLIPMVVDEFKSKRTEETNEQTDDELRVVLSGNEAYKKGIHLRDLFLEFTHHQSQLREKLVVQEKNILRLMSASLDSCL